MESNLYKVFNNIIMPAEAVLQKIETTGAYVDYDKLLEVRESYEETLVLKTAELNAALPRFFKDREINWNSPKQVAEVLFKGCGLKPIGFTDTGEPQTGKGTLLRLVDKHPVPALLLDVRKYSKAINGFLQPWQEYLDYEVAHGRPPRLHTTYKIAHTNTGRLSAENPNLQQVSRDKNIRSLIAAPEGRVIIEADYSQIELRIAAYIARALSMLRVYRDGGDLHSKTGCSLARVTPEELTKPQRTNAKAVNFGFIYGMWWKTFKAYAFDSYGVVVSDKEAEAFRNTFFTLYPELLVWHSKTKAVVRRDRCIVTPLERVRYLQNIDSPDKELRGKAERQGINTPVQSMASDMLLLALIEIDKRLPDNAFLVGEIHDATLTECDEKDAVEVGTMIKEVMEAVPNTLKKMFKVELDVPIIADVTIGKGWGSGVPLEEYKSA